MRRHLITIEDTGEAYACREDETLVAGMERAGCRGIPVGCRGGGCGVCKVGILSGEVALRKMSRAHVSGADESNGRVLACRAQPRGPVVLCVLGRMRMNLFPGDGRPASGARC